MGFKDEKDNSGINDWVIGNKDIQFNHEALVMLSYKKCIESLSKEMREGFWMERYDKMGNQIYVYQPDTRKEAIEAVKTLKNLMIYQIKKHKFGEGIKKLEEKSDNTFKKALEMNKKNVRNNLRTPEQRQQYYISGGEFNEDNLNDKSPYWHWYIEQKIEIYRQLFELLEECMAAAGYMKGQDYTEDED